MNMTRSELLQEIFFDETLVKSEFEWFQNKYLRGIIKFQHAHLVTVSIGACRQMNPSFDQLLLKERKLFLIQTLQNNQALRNLMIGLVVGFLELEQLEWYLKNKTECNKRILQMIEKRVAEAV